MIYSFSDSRLDYLIQYLEKSEKVIYFLTGIQGKGFRACSFLGSYPQAETGIKSCVFYPSN